MDGFLAKSKSQNKWFERLDTNAPEAGFSDSVAEQFQVNKSDVEVVKKILASENERKQIAQELVAGMHDNLEVIPATDPAGSDISNLLLQDTTGMTTEQKLARLDTLMKHIFKRGNITV